MRLQFPAVHFFVAAVLRLIQDRTMADLVEDDETLVRLTLLSKSTRLPKDLTGGSANLIFTIDGGTATNVGMTVENATAGIVSYRFQVGQLTPGRLRADIQSTDSDGFTVRTTDVLALQIRRKIA